jgi:hypothetical protein
MILERIKGFLGLEVTGAIAPEDIDRTPVREGFSLRAFYPHHEELEAGSLRLRRHDP